MKKEAKLLLGKGIDSLTLAIEHFNRPSDMGRVTTTLLLLDHSFEMLLKAAIVHKGGKIREQRATQTIGFDTCIRKALSEKGVRFLSKEQALTLQAINGFRDAAQHYLLTMSEQHFYIHAQAGVTLFRDLCRTVFDLDLCTKMPSRVLPVSAEPPTTIAALFDKEMDVIKDMLQPKTRKKTEAQARLRSLAILEESIQGQYTQPSPGELAKMADAIRTGKTWYDLFPGVASIEITTKGSGPSLDLRITKKDEAIPITIVPEGTPGAGVVALKRVNELDFYNLGHRQLAEHVGLTPPRLTALLRYLEIENDSECFKEIKIGKATYKRYSQKAIAKVTEILAGGIDMDDVWHRYRPRKKV